MAARRIRIQSRALGDTVRVEVYVYDDLDAMRRAGKRFSGENLGSAIGLTQAVMSARVDASGEMSEFLLARPVVRLWRGRLGTQVISHEMHHAATALYGASLPTDTLASDVLTHYNEPFAHLYSDLMHHLVDALYRHGYYAPAVEEVAS